MLGDWTSQSVLITSSLCIGKMSHPKWSETSLWCTGKLMALAWLSQPPQGTCRIALCLLLSAQVTQRLETKHKNYDCMMAELQGEKTKVPHLTSLTAFLPLGISLWCLQVLQVSIFRNTNSWHHPLPRNLCHFVASAQSLPEDSNC